jgi:hypothetical protein
VRQPRRGRRRWRGRVLPVTGPAGAEEVLCGGASVGGGLGGARDILASLSTGPT